MKSPIRTANLSDAIPEKCIFSVYRLACFMLVFIICGVFPAKIIAQTITNEPQAAEQNAIERRTVSIGPAENIVAALVRIGANSGDAAAAQRALARTIDTDDIKRDDQLTVFLRKDGNTKRLLGFTLASGSSRSITVTRTLDGTYRARELQTTMQRRILRVAGVIGENGLVPSVREQGAPDRAAESLADAFAFDVDFEREIGPGSSFELMYERVSDARGAVVREGEPIFASITTLTGRTVVVYRFQPNGGISGWYDATGRSSRKFLMKNPVSGARLTSGFGRRIHPITGYSRMHEGIDFGVPIGTPVMTAGDGVVSRVGRMGGYGNVVDVEHAGGWLTRYAHLSSFASGLRVGDRVRQGQVIALSGNTGRSTGPHLHYETRKDGVAINPSSANIPAGQPLNGEALAQFNAQVARVNAARRENMSGVANQSGRN